ncbi:hypothetical protein Pelo_13433 [Pelomyxa schiedti]|nr:hypothetical protein Pelo_13433 [Pelomyxa schiedti]
MKLCSAENCGPGKLECLLSLVSQQPHVPNSGSTCDICSVCQAYIECILKHGNRPITLSEEERTELEDIMSQWISYLSSAKSVYVSQEKLMEEVQLSKSLSFIGDKSLKEWALSLSQCWGSHYRTIRNNMSPNCPLLHTPNPYVATQNDTWFYWDSFFVVLGLLECQMFETSGGTIQNLLRCISQFKKVPCGGSVEMMDFTHPPLLPLMVNEWCKRNFFQGKFEEAQNLARIALPLLEIEHTSWISTGGTHCLAQWAGGPPPGYGSFCERPHCTSISLNTIIFVSEVCIADLGSLVHQASEYSKFWEYARQRAIDIGTHLWNEDEVCWEDICPPEAGRPSTWNEYAMQLIPLWAQSYLSQPPWGLHPNHHLSRVRAIRKLFDNEEEVPYSFVKSTCKDALNWMEQEDAQPWLMWFVAHSLRRMSPQVSKSFVSDWLQSFYQKAPARQYSPCTVGLLLNLLSENADLMEFPISDPLISTFIMTLASNLRRVLGTGLHGVYLTGSAATGSYIHGVSDIDIICVCNDRLSSDRKAAVSMCVISTSSAMHIEKVEVDVYSLSAVQEGSPEFEVKVTYFGENKDSSITNSLEEYLRQGGKDFWLVMDYENTYLNGVAVMGPPARSIFSRVNHGKMVQSITGAITLLLERVSQPTVKVDMLCSAILHICRGWYWIVTGLLSPKVFCAKWALLMLVGSAESCPQNLEFHSVVSSAVQSRTCPTTHLSLPSETVASFARYVLSVIPNY